MPSADAGRNQTKAAGRQLGAGNPFLAARRSPCRLYPDVAVSAVSYPLGVDAGDAPGRGFAVRVEVFIRLQPLFASVFAAAVLRSHPGLATTTWRYRGVSAPAR